MLTKKTFDIKLKNLHGALKKRPMHSYSTQKIIVMDLAFLFPELDHMGHAIRKFVPSVGNVEHLDARFSETRRPLI